MSNKILIVIDNLNTGGIATSLYNLLPQIVINGVKCDLLVFDEKSIDYSRIPKEIRIISTDWNLRILGKTQDEVVRLSSLAGCKRALFVLISRIISGNFARKCIFFREKSLLNYDIAIAYCHDLGVKSLTPGCRQFVDEKVQARKKAVYIHCDYQLYGGFSRKQLKDYGKFDEILCVSQSCKNSFIKCFPELNDRTTVLQNFTDVARINEKAAAAIKYRNKEVTFVSVCRLSEEKAIERTVRILSKLYYEGYVNFSWVIVGSGPKEDEIKRIILEHAMQDKILLVGNQENPYVYMKNASALLLLSYHEAAPMVYGESQVLHVPVISTNTLSARELVEDRGIGIVCENSEKGIYIVLKEILANPKKLENFKSISDVNGEAEIQLKRFLNMME